MQCLYEVQEIIDKGLPIDECLMEIVRNIHRGWQYPDNTRARITYEDRVYLEEGWDETDWVQSTNLVIDDKIHGRIEVFYTDTENHVGDNPFLPEEQKLLNTIASKISSYIFNKKLLSTLEILKNEKGSYKAVRENPGAFLPVESDIHWVWRYNVAKRIAEKLDFDKYGVQAFYLIGSAKNATSGPASDIDILIHFRGSENQKKLLREWFEGWSYGLDELNYYKTGYRTNGIIDLHIVTDEDIKNRDSFASMIGAVNDGARLIRSRANE